jgi:acetolactate synthase-1/2/3 large subunit
VKERHAKYLEFSTPVVRTTPRVSMERVSQDLTRLLPKDTILTVDAGNFSGWIHRYYRFDTPQSFYGPTVGSMGYGLPSALGAKLAHPNRTVIATCGDGGAMMTIQELATAVQHKIPVILLVFNNGTYGTIRMHQERDFPGRTVATDLSNPDFAALGRAMGAEGYSVKTSDEFAPALQAALASGKPAVLDVQTDPEHISVSQTISDLRAGKGVSRRAK